MLRLRKIACTALAAALSLSLATGVAHAAYGTGTVTEGPLRLRAEASTSSAILAKAALGTEVEVLEDAQNGWYKVSFAGKEGYMSADFLSVIPSQEIGSEVVSEPVAMSYDEYVEEPAAVEAPAAEETPAADDAPAAEEAPAEEPAGEDETLCALVTASPSLNVRSGPGTGFTRIGSLRCGTVIDVVEQGEEWSLIRYGAANGYVCNEFLIFLASTGMDESYLGVQAVAMARQYVGCPYVYGGTSPSGFDCSGIIYYVYKSLGHTIARTGSAMWNSLTHVDGELLPGDIVCFTRTTNSGSYITHVGMYIGGGQFLHASTPRTGVIVSSLGERYYADRYAGALRVA